MAIELNRSGILGKQRVISYRDSKIEIKKPLIKTDRLGFSELISVTNEDSENEKLKGFCIFDNFSESYISGVIWETGTTGALEDNMIKLIGSGGDTDYLESKAKENIGNTTQIITEFKIKISVDGSVSGFAGLMDGTINNRGAYFKIENALTPEGQVPALRPTTKQIDETAGSPTNLINGKVYKCRIDLTANRANFYLNGTLLQTIETNLPTGAIGFYASATSGVAVITAYIDDVFLQYNPNKQ